MHFSPAGKYRSAMAALVLRSCEPVPVEGENRYLQMQV